MRVELGNAHAQEEVDGVRRALPDQRVSYLFIPNCVTEDGAEHYGHPEVHSDDLYPAPLKANLAMAAGNAIARRYIINEWLSQPAPDGTLGVNGLPNHEAFVSVIHPLRGFWQAHSAPGTVPTWVWSDNPALQKHLAEHYGCAEGRPTDLEDTHITQYGVNIYPAGAAPDPLGGITALHTNIGRDLQAVEMFGFGYLGTSGIATAAGTTSLTGGTETGVSHSANDCAGQWIFAGKDSTGAGALAYGFIVSNTSGTSPVYTIDRWYAAATPGGAAASTPSNTAQYIVTSGGPPQLFVGLTANSATPLATDTTLPSEITTSGGGLIRKIAPIGHTAGAATVTMTPVFTANGSDSLPVTIAKAGAGPSIVATVNNSYQTLVSPTATLSSSGDQLTLTWTYTMT